MHEDKNLVLWFSDMVHKFLQSLEHISQEGLEPFKNPRNSLEGGV